MSPKIWVGKNLVADVVDETGWHQTLDGTPLYVNVDLIDANKQQQRIILESERIGGLRVIGLSQEGKGNSISHRGDGKNPPIRVYLNDAPIRITYRDRVWTEPTPSLSSPRPEGYYRDTQRTYLNPRWMQNRERR